MELTGSNLIEIYIWLKGSSEIFNYDASYFIQKLEFLYLIFAFFKTKILL